MGREVLIATSNPQTEIQKHSETANWEYRDQANFLYTVGSEMMSRFFNGLVYLDGKKVPDPLIAFDNLRNNNVLAQYDLRPDEYGLMYKITFNTAHIVFCSCLTQSPTGDATISRDLPSDSLIQTIYTGIYQGRG